MNDEPNPYDSPQEASQDTRPPRRTRWKLWASLGLLLGAIAAGVGVHFYISLSRMTFERHGPPLPVEEVVEAEPNASV